LLLVCSNALHVVHAQSTLLDEVHTIAAPTTAVPVEHSFTVATAGDYNVTLTDLGAQLNPTAPLASVKLAVTSNDTLVGTALVGAGTLLLKGLQPGDYQYHVVGMPGTVGGSGLFGVQITSVADGSSVAAYSDTLALPPGTLASGEATLDGTFTVQTPGSYQVSLADLNLPATLPALTLALLQEGGSSTLAILPDPVTGARQATVQLTNGVNYRLFAAAQADPTANAGLFSATVAPSGGGTPVYQATQPVGAFTQLGTTPTLNAGSYTVTLADLATPAALVQLAAVLIQNGTAAVTVSASGSQAFTASGGTYQVFAVATPASSPGTGSYSVAVQPQGGAPVLSVARAVAVPGGLVSAYSFDTTVPTAGGYALALADFTFPAKFTSLSAAAVQNGALLDTALTAAGTENITAASGPLSLLVFAQADSSGSLFGLDLTSSAGGSPVFATNQGVGQLFASRPLTVPTAGTYTVTAKDLAFPAALASFAVIVTQGTNQVGTIFGGGTFQASAGDYFVTFIAQPGGTDKAGTYALDVSLVPVVTLQSSATSVAAGGTVTLTWTSQNATACVASGGGWSGSQVLNGSATSPAISAATTFTLTCTGPGGSIAKSVAVTVAAPTKSGGSGGGGALSVYFVLILSGVVLLRLREPLR
jgi:hypothetical protein